MCVCVGTGHVGGCGVTDEVAAWMDNIQHGAEDESAWLEEDVSDPAASNEIDNNMPAFKRAKATEATTTTSSASWYKYSHHANVGEGHRQRELPEHQHGNLSSHHREKRNSKSPVSRTTCSLFIQTDPLLWKHFYEVEKRNADNTRKEITSLIAQHVKAVNAIYMETRFDGKFPHRMTRFEVQRIKIDDYEPCEPNYVGEENKFCLPNIDVSNFLNLHSQGNHEDFCLAYVFTYRYVTWWRMQELDKCVTSRSYPLLQPIYFIAFPFIFFFQRFSETLRAEH